MSFTYTVSYSTSPNGPWTVAVSGLTTTTDTITGLTAGQNYYVRIGAVDNATKLISNYVVGPYTTAATGVAVTDTTGSVTDSTGVKWTLVGSPGAYQIARNGTTDPNTANVIEILYLNNVIYQENGSYLWWSWTNNAWVSCPSPLASVGPVATGGTINVDFSTPTSRVVARELFGAATAAMLDNSFAVCAQTGFQQSAKSLTVPLLRLNPNSGGSGGFPFVNVFQNGVNNPDWSSWNNLLQNLYKIVDLKNTKLVVGIGFPFFGSYSTADFATACTKSAQFLSTQPGGDGNPLNPMFWEIMNEPDGNIAQSDYINYFNAAADALHAVNPNYVVSGPVSANDFGWMTALISGSNSARLQMGCVHRYYYCPGDAVPTDVQAASATLGINSPESFASSVDSAVNSTYLQYKPFLLGEYNLICGEYSGSTEPRMQGIVGACYAASYLLKMQASTANPIWAAIWDFYADGNYGVIGGSQHSPYGISPQGYFLSQAAQVMPGPMVTVTNNASGSLNVYATQNSAKFGVCAVNYTTSGTSGTVALNKWPVNTTGNATINVWTINSSNPAGTKSTVSVTNGVTGSITFPAQSVTLLYP